MPTFGYKTKWAFVEGLPLVALSLLLLTHVFLVVKKRILFGRKDKINSHLPALVGTALTMMYYLDLNLTRSVLDMFNCQQSSPPDGHKYLRT